MVVRGTSETTAYKRVRPDGTVSICGVFFTGDSKVHATIAKPTVAATGEALRPEITAWPEELSDDSTVTVAGLARTAIAQCEKLEGCGFAATTLRQIADAYASMVQVARETHRKLVYEQTEVARLKTDAEVVPEILRASIKQHETEVSELKERIEDLERECHVVNEANAAAAAALGATAANGAGASAARRRSSGNSGNTTPTFQRRSHGGRSPTPQGQNGTGTALVPAPPSPAAASPGERCGVERGPTPQPRPQRPASAQPCWTQKEDIPIPRRPVTALANRSTNSYDLEVRDFELPTLNVRPSHYTSQLSHVYTSSNDVRERFESLDTNKVGYLTFQTVLQYYKGIDDFGVPRSEEQMQRHLRSCFIRGDPDGRMSFEEFELFCLSITKR